MNSKVVFICTILTASMTVGVPLNNEDKANTFWRKYFCSAWSSLPWKQGADTFNTERIAQNRTLIGSCSVDIGTCPIGSCTTSFLDFFKCPADGFTCPQTETRTQDCGVYGVRKYEHVTGCGCCKDLGIQVEATVTDSATNTPLKDIKINVGKNIMGETDAKGKLFFNINSKTQSAVLESYDSMSTFMDAVNVLKIPEDFRGPVKFEIAMVRKPVPVLIDNTRVTTLSLSKNPANAEVGNAFVVIDGDSFTDMLGNPYKGPVNASVTFVDPSLDSPAGIPGLFLTKVGNITENLISDGMFAFEFKGENGKEVVSGPVKVTVRKGMQLWNLDKETGLWEPANVQHGRKRRQADIATEYTINIANRQWINIDRISQSPRCFFKVRVFSEDTGAELGYSHTTFFKPEILGLTKKKNVLQFYPESNQAPRDTCYEVRCPIDMNNPFEPHTGLINMTALEMISVDGVNVPYITYLKPFDPSFYDATRPLLDAVKYTVATNKLDIFVHFISNPNGPFFTDKTTCAKSSVDSPSFNFVKPSPPKYYQEPDMYEICTARIDFKDRWNFYNYTKGLKELPSVTAISVWNSFNEERFYTDKALIVDSASGADYFLSSCVKYRCSNPSEPTIVYLDIDVPNLTDSYQYTNHSDGTLVKKTFSVSAFYCEGKCVGPLCKTQSMEVSDTTVDGSFEAEVKVRNTLDSKNCDKGSDATKTFDFQFSCISREGHA